MTDKDNGGYINPPGFHGGSKGITRRDWLAGLAMQGLIVDIPEGYGMDLISRDAYKIADAMIAEGKK